MYVAGTSFIITRVKKRLHSPSLRDAYTTVAPLSLQKTLEQIKGGRDGRQRNAKQGTKDRSGIEGILEKGFGESFFFFLDGRTFRGALFKDFV